MKFCRTASASAIAIAVAFPATGAAMAQSSGSVDQITVTGSYIGRKSQADLPSPLDVIDAGEISKIGAQNIADITRTLTVSTGAQNNPDAFTQNLTTGTSNINLRGMGLGSTLVLLDGHRQVLSGAPANDGTTFVDTSSLVPMIAIDRVEILLDGASALYGSDAVAGVANFITRKNFDGVLLSGNYMSHQSEGDYGEYNIQGLAGRDFGRMSLMAAVSYTDRSALTTAERRLSRIQDDTSAIGNPGTFVTLPPPVAYYDLGCEEAGGYPLPAAATAEALADFEQGIGYCGFDFGSYYNLVPDETRFVSLVRADAALTDAINWSVEFGYADNEAVRNNSPSFPFLRFDKALTIPLSHPGLDAGLLANDNLGVPFSFAGRPVGNGGSPVPNTTQTETWRVSTTLEGDIASGRWELSFTQAENRFHSATEDTVADRFQCALTGFNYDGVFCVEGNADLTPADGSSIPVTGTYYNPFSTSFTDYPNDPALLDYLTELHIRDYEAGLTVVEGYVTQEAFLLPAGPVSVALGAQYRRNSLSQTVDALSLNDAFGFLIGGRDFDGTQDVLAGFGEAYIPLASWADLQIAVRHEHYGDEEGGSTTDPKVALLVRPADTLSLRGSFSTSFRAPSVFQQYGELTTLTQLDDDGSVAFTSVRTLAPEGDNGELLAREITPEESRAFNAGFSWMPVDGLELDVDYFNYDFTDVIIVTNPQAILDLANSALAKKALDSTVELSAAEDLAISSVMRSSTGLLEQVTNNFENASSVKTSGLDFSLRYSMQTAFGMLMPSFEGTYIRTYDLTDPQAGEIDGAGVRNYENFGTSTPQLRFNAGLGWSRGAHSANVYARYIGSYQDDQNDYMDIDSDLRIDIHYSIDVGSYFQSGQQAALSIGARNVTGARPPQVYTNGGFDSKVHDPRGALVYVGLDIGL